MDNLPPGYDSVSDPQQIFGIDVEEPAPKTVAELQRSVAIRASYALIKTCNEMDVRMDVPRAQMEFLIKIALTDYETRRKLI